ncbi:hypothetical protein HGA92_01775 [Candidatus Gracilibacteria bacterium]|nr:hypothetical protein [Candidatus Gracilibacteria bacterium]NUJ99492.1 hypothetical protein [Candidatus Gracilibacteria bacterium]
MKKGEIDFGLLDKKVEDFINSNFDIKDIEKNFKKSIKKKDLIDIIETLEKNRLYNGIEEDGFSKRLDIRWGKLFNKISYIIDFSFYSIYEGQQFIDRSNVRNHVLLKLHSKQILLAKEILILLRNGYGEGANARWRSLYENVVITLFISNNGNELAKRFLEHKNIFNYKESLKYKDSYKKLKHRGYGKDNFKELEEEKERLLKKYGKSFFGDYGWITDDILKNKNFTEIEKIVDMAHFKPYFSLSSRSIHSSSKSFDNLGKRNDDLNLIGPSNIGLIDPIQNTTMFLMKGATFILIDFIKQLDDKDIKNKIILLYFTKILIGLDISTGKEAIKVQDEIDRDEILLNEFENEK